MHFSVDIVKLSMPKTYYSDDKALFIETSYSGTGWLQAVLYKRNAYGYWPYWKAIHKESFREGKEADCEEWIKDRLSCPVFTILQYCG